MPEQQPSLNLDEIERRYHVAIGWTNPHERAKACEIFAHDNVPALIARIRELEQRGTAPKYTVIPDSSGFWDVEADGVMVATFRTEEIPDAEARAKALCDELNAATPATPDYEGALREIRDVLAKSIRPFEATSDIGVILARVLPAKEGK